MSERNSEVEPGPQVRGVAALRFLLQLAVVALAYWFAARRQLAAGACSRSGDAHLAADRNRPGGDSRVWQAGLAGHIPGGSGGEPAHRPVPIGRRRDRGRQHAGPAGRRGAAQASLVSESSWTVYEMPLPSSCSAPSWR